MKMEFTSDQEANAFLAVLDAAAKGGGLQVVEIVAHFKRKFDEAAKAAQDAAQAPKEGN